MFSQRVSTAGERGNGQDPGATQREPASAFLLIDSFDRHQGPDPFDVLQDLTQPINNFVIQKRQPFISGFFNRIAVIEYRFPFGTPNINIRNNIIVVDPAAGPQVEITIPEGFYTPDELAAELDTQLTATIAGQTWAVVYDEELGTFSVTSNANFFFLPYQYPTAQQSLKGLYHMMNFGSLQAPALVQTSLPFPQMQYTSYIDVCSRQLTQYQQVKDNSTRDNQSGGVLARIYLNTMANENLGDGGTSAKLTWPGCRPQMVYRFVNVPKYVAWSPGSFIDQIDIQLFDDAGNPLYYGSNNAINTANDFQLSLHCSEN
jgi:hypothetical protein